MRDKSAKDNKISRILIGVATASPPHLCPSIFDASFGRFSCAAVMNLLVIMQ